MDTVEYWQKREKDHIKAEQMKDEEVKSRMKTIITNHMNHVQSEIETFYRRYADAEGLPYAEAKKLIDRTDIDDYKALAEYYVKNRHDKEIAFSKKANREMKLYNVTMKINREQLVLARMTEHLKNMGAEIEEEMKDYLNDSTVREFERQAGLLGDISTAETQLEAIINSTHLTDKKIWSERLWENISDVQQEVDKTIKDVMLRGRHPDDGVKRLRELTGRSEFEARRLLLTETTRVQSEAQLLSMRDKKTASFIFIAQIDERTTVKCREMNKEVIKLADAVIGKNVPPLHQFCRSTTAPNIDPDDVFEQGGGVFNLFNYDDEEDVELDEEDIVGDDPNEALLDDLNGVLDNIEQKMGKEYKQEKVKQVEKVVETHTEPEPLNPVLNQQLKSKMGQKHIDQAEQMLSEAPEVAQKVWTKYSDRMKLGRTNETGAHFDPGLKHVNMHIKETFEKDGDKKPKGDTFFHEFAHNIDDLVYRDHKLGLRGHYTQHFYSEKYGMTWEEVMNKEINNLVNQRNKAFKKQYEAGELKHIGAEMNNGKWKKEFTYELLTQEFREIGAFETSAFSDIFSGVTKNKLRIYWGHSTAYWKQHGNTVAFEAFANLFGAIMTSYETYKLAKETLPETVEVFEELLAYLAGEDEEQ